jgi:hypothetical protein
MSFFFFIALLSFVFAAVGYSVQRCCSPPCLDPCPQSDRSSADGGELGARTGQALRLRLPTSSTLCIPKIDPDRHATLGDAAWNFGDKVLRWLSHGHSLSDSENLLIPFLGRHQELTRSSFSLLIQIRNRKPASISALACYCQSRLKFLKTAFLGNKAVHPVLGGFIQPGICSPATARSA